MSNPELLSFIEHNPCYVGLSLILFGAFSLKIRNWWMRVGDNKCQYEFYDEKRGWQTCNKPATQVHHIIPERWTKAQGKDPDDNIGLPLCDRHHVKNTSDEEHSWEFSFHPDIGKAYQQYSEWKRQKQHMDSIRGRRSYRRDSPFDEVINEHEEKVRRKERYWAGTPEIDRYYEEKMRDMAASYVARTGDKKPKKHERKTTK